MPEPEPALRRSFRRTTVASTLATTQAVMSQKKRSRQPRSTPEPSPHKTNASGASVKGKSSYGSLPPSLEADEEEDDDSDLLRDPLAAPSPKRTKKNATPAGSPRKKKSEKRKRVVLENGAGVSDDEDSDDNGDIGLQIPGEAVLAYYIGDKHRYYPAQIEEYIRKNKKYKLRFCTNHVATVARNQFVSKLDERFTTVETKQKIGDIDARVHSDTPDLSFEDTELESEMESIVPRLLDLVKSDPASSTSWRYKAFFSTDPADAKRLLKEVTHGSLSLNQVELVVRMLKRRLFPHLPFMDGAMGSRGEAGSEARSKRQRVKEEAKAGDGLGRPVSPPPSQPDSGGPGAKGDLHDVQGDNDELGAYTEPAAAAQKSSVEGASGLCEDPSSTAGGDNDELGAYTEPAAAVQESSVEDASGLCEDPSSTAGADSGTESPLESPTANAEPPDVIDLTDDSPFCPNTPPNSQPSSSKPRYLSFHPLKADRFIRTVLVPESSLYITSRRENMSLAEAGGPNKREMGWVRRLLGMRESLMLADSVARDKQDSGKFL
ncbi:hypothetical protein HK104_007450 [Borealophlyctis nickersoniae]|nr:hypothetical protein HK104_007450 [Borealophlyctis nickersoniae]